MTHVRVWTTALCTAVTVCALAAQTPRRRGSSLTPSRVFARCPDAAPEHQAAAARLRQLKDQVERLEDAAPPAPVLAELRSLLESNCFQMASEARRVLEPDTSVSLTEWWATGGEDWLDSYLELPRLGTLPQLRPHVVIPPDARRTLYLQANRAHPLQLLLCPLGDAGCGAETRGWKIRADAAFAAQDAIEQQPQRDLDRPGRPSAEDAARNCATQTGQGAGAGQYQAWRACLDSVRPKRTALPLGDFKAPDAGWVIISGRRGHYEFCDRTSAYDLATGSAFVYESCSELVLNHDGSVYRAATDQNRTERVRTGRLHVDNLREAIWMMLLRSEAEVVQLRAETYPLPDGIVLQIAAGFGRTAATAWSMSTWSTTAQTMLTWRWMPGNGRPLAGTVTWPNSSDAAEAHAAALLDVAEQGLVEGCPARAAPQPSAVKTVDPVRLDDVADDVLRDLDVDYAKAFARWKSVKTCG
jgi:hypothetical protein